MRIPEYLGNISYKLMRYFWYISCIFLVYYNNYRPLNIFKILRAAANFAQMLNAD
jgi:hypothetical protein